MAGLGAFLFEDVPQGLPADLLDAQLAESDSFILGNAVGESGNSADDPFVNAFDFAGPRDNLSTTADVLNLDDYNRDGLVDGADMAVARDNTTDFDTSLRLFTPTAPAAPQQVMLTVVDDKAVDETGTRDHSSLLAPPSQKLLKNPVTETRHCDSEPVGFKPTAFASEFDIDPLISDELLQLLAEAAT